MALLSNALRQAFMPKHEYDNLREEDKALIQLQRPVLISLLLCIVIVIVVSTSISVKIVFPAEDGKRVFCRDLRIQPLSINVSSGGGGGGEDVFPGAFYSLRHIWPTAMVWTRVLQNYVALETLIDTYRNDKHSCLFDVAIAKIMCCKEY